VDVEMQTWPRPYQRERSLFYWARIYESAVSRGGSLASLSPCVVVFIFGYRELPSDRFHCTFRLLDVDDHAPFSEHIEIHTVELPKLPRLAGDEPDLVRWGRFLAARTDTERAEVAMEDPTVGKAKAELDRLSLDRRARRLARRRDLAAINNRTALEAAQQKGEAKGRVEGLLIAIESTARTLGIDLDAKRRARLHAMSEEELLAAQAALVERRRWPDR
jgi:predicted transposase/invertase (TIGR01784 family)